MPELGKPGRGRFAGWGPAAVPRTICLRGALWALSLTALAGLTACATTSAPATFIPADDFSSGDPATGAALDPGVFEMQGWAATSEIDDQHQAPRAYLTMQFTSGTAVSLVLRDPRGVATGLPQRFAEGAVTARLPLATSILETPLPGRYVINVSDWAGEPLTTVEVAFKGADLAVTNTTYQAGDSLSPNTLTIRVLNVGDLPAFVTDAAIWLAGTPLNPTSESHAILPGRSADLPFRWYSEGDPLQISAKDVDLRLTDRVGNVVARHGSPADEVLVSASFEVIEWGMVSELDPSAQALRAYMEIRFSSDVPVALALIGPDGLETAAPFRVTEDVTIVKLPMTRQALETPALGTYSLEANLWTGEALARAEIAEFEGASITVTDVAIASGSGVVPHRLTVNVSNGGDLPAYVTGADIQVDAASPSARASPQSILPGDSEALAFEWDGGPSPDTSAPTSIDLALKDGTGNTLTEYLAHLQLDVMVTFVSATAPYAISYPETWLVTEDAFPGGSLLTIQHPTGEAWIAISAYRLPGQQLDQWVNATIGTRRSEWLSFELLSDQSATWKGMDVRWLSWVGRIDTPDKLKRTNELCVADGDWRLSVQGSALGPVHADYAAQLDSILNGFSVMFD